MKVVIDTNLIISAMYFGGKPKMLTDLLRFTGIRVRI